MCVGLDANRRVIAVSDGIFSFCVDATHPPELVAHALGERRVRSNFCEIKFIGARARSRSPKSVKSVRVRAL